MNTPSTDALKPCPFCGANPGIEFSHEAGRWDIYEFECECGISAYGPCGYEGEAAKQAIARKWNTRTPNARLANSEEMVEHGRQAFIVEALKIERDARLLELTGDEERALIRAILAAITEGQSHES